MAAPVYLDNHATTRVDPRVVEAMLPYFGEVYGNAGSTTHAFGWEARDAVRAARETIARAINAAPDEIIFTSGATESDNLAIFGVAERAKRRGDHLVSVTTEHKAVLDPLYKLRQRGYEVTLLPVAQAPSTRASGAERTEQGRVPRSASRTRRAQARDVLSQRDAGQQRDRRHSRSPARSPTFATSRASTLHCDATQAVGKLPVDVRALGVDLLSFTAHKLHGPKGIGALYIRRHDQPVRLEPQMFGGGQEAGFRSGTLNVPGIVGFAKAAGTGRGRNADGNSSAAGVTRSTLSRFM